MNIVTTKFCICLLVLLIVNLRKMSYGDIHRFLLRLIASQSVMSLQDIKQLVEKKAGDAVDLKVMVNDINEKIKPLKQEIKFVKDEVTTEDLVVFLSTGYDATTKAQNVFTAVELEFFRVLIEEIMSIATREITEISALNLVNNIKVGKKNSTLSKIDAQRILRTWCRMQYLQMENNYYVLGVRAITEFESYLLTNMRDVMKKCSRCETIVYRGYNCPYCAMPTHIRCLHTFLGKSQRWPCCKQEYIHSHLEQLRGQISRLAHSLEATYLMDPSQVYEPTELMDPSQELEPTQLMDPSHELEPTQLMDPSQELEPTQPMQNIDTSINQEDSDVMEVDNTVVNDSRRSRKRKLRLVIHDDSD